MQICRSRLTTSLLRSSFLLCSQPPTSKLTTNQFIHMRKNLNSLNLSFNRKLRKQWEHLSDLGLLVLNFFKISATLEAVLIKYLNRNQYKKLKLKIKSLCWIQLVNKKKNLICLIWVLSFYLQIQSSKRLKFQSILLELTHKIKSFYSL